MRANGIAEKKSDLFKITWKATEKAGTSCLVRYFSFTLKKAIVSLSCKMICNENV